MVEQLSLREERVNFLNKKVINLTDLSIEEYKKAVSENLSELLNQFPTFSLSIGMKRKVFKRYCDGNCYNLVPPLKYNQNEMIYFEDHPNHAFCKTCIDTWIFNRLNENPTKDVICQRCQISSTLVKYTIPMSYIITIVNPQALQWMRDNYIDPELYSSCSVMNCGAPVPKANSMSFLCGHYFCRLHAESLIFNTLDKYYDYLCNGYNDVSNIYFELLCECKNEISRNSIYQYSLISIISGSQYYASKNDYLWFVNQYPNFFQGLVNLIRCSKCKTVYELSSAVLNCERCKWCMLGNHEVHAGISCNEYLSLNNVYTQGKVINSPQPNDDQNIVQIFAKLSTKVEEVVVPPKRVINIIPLENTFLNYLFKFARSKKKYILSNGYTKQEADEILKNNLKPISGDIFSFPMKINFRDEAARFFYCEVMYDREIKTDIMTEEIAPGEYVLSEYTNTYSINSLNAIKILFLMTVG